MQPTNYSSYQTQTPLGKWLRVVVALVVVLLLVLIGFGVSKSLKFHLIKTDPKLAAVASYTTDLSLYYSKTVNAKSLNLYDPGGMISKTAVNGKIVTLTFRIPLQVGRNYEFIIRSIKSTDGSEIKNQTIAFTAKDIPFDDLSKEQQQKIVSQQDHYTYTVPNIHYTGFDSLVDQGVTTGEVLDIETDIFDYSNLVHEQFRNVPLDTNSLVIRFHDPAAREANASSATFNVTLGGVVYSVRSEYDGISDTTYTRVFNSGGSAVFDSSAQ